jgi:pimeloyl-ACP methyl ester carboxylesterase
MIRWLKRLFWLWLGWRVLGPEPQPKTDEGQEHPLRLPGRSVFVGDNEFFVREAGDSDSPPLVLVHGWGDHSLVVWWKLIERLAAQYRVVVPDTRSTGKSDPIRGRFEVADLADDLAGVMTAVGIESAHVAGYSLGGMVALELAHRHPHRVDKLILAGTSAGPARSLPERLVGGVAIVLARALDRLSRSEVSRARSVYLEGVGAVLPRHARWAYWQHQNRDPDLYWLSGAAVNRFDARPWIGKLRQSCLVIINTEDQLMFPEVQYELASLLHDAEVVELVGARHEAPLTHAGHMIRAIESFLGE